MSWLERCNHSQWLFEMSSVSASVSERSIARITNSTSCSSSATQRCLCYSKINSTDFIITNTNSTILLLWNKQLHLASLPLLLNNPRINNYLLTYSLTPHSRALLEKLTGFQLIKKSPAFYGTQKFITTFTSARHPSLSWASSIQSVPPHPTFWSSS